MSIFLNVFMIHEACSFTLDTGVSLEEKKKKIIHEFQNERENFKKWKYFKNNKKKFSHTYPCFIDPPLFMAFDLFKSTNETEEKKKFVK